MAQKISQTQMEQPDSTAYSEVMMVLGALNYSHSKKNNFIKDERGFAGRDRFVGGGLVSNTEYNQTMTALRPNNFEAFKKKRLKEIEAYFAQKEACDRVDFEVYQMMNISSHPNPYFDNQNEVMLKCRDKFMEGGATRGQWEDYYNYFRNGYMTYAQDTVNTIKQRMKPVDALILQEYMMLSLAENYAEFAQRMGQMPVDDVLSLSAFPLASKTLWLGETGIRNVYGNEAYDVLRGSAYMVALSPVLGGWNFYKEIRGDAEQADKEMLQQFFQSNELKNSSRFDVFQNINNLLSYPEELQPSNLDLMKIAQSGLQLYKYYDEDANPNEWDQYLEKWARQLRGGVTPWEGYQDHLDNQKFDMIIKPASQVKGKVQAHEDVMTSIENSQWFKLMHIYYYEQEKQKQAEEKRSIEEQEEYFVQEEKTLKEKAQEDIEKYKASAKEARERWQKLKSDKNASLEAIKAAYDEYVNWQTASEKCSNRMNLDLSAMKRKHEDARNGLKDEHKRQRLFDLIDWYGEDDPTNGKLKKLKEKYDELSRIEKAYHDKVLLIETEYKQKSEESAREARQLFFEKEENARVKQEVEIWDNELRLCDEERKGIDVTDSAALAENERKRKEIERTLERKEKALAVLEKELEAKIAYDMQFLAESMSEQLVRAGRNYDAEVTPVKKSIKYIEKGIERFLPLEPEPLNDSTWYPAGQYSRDFLMAEARRAGLVPLEQDFQPNNFEAGTMNYSMALLIKKLRDSGMKEEAGILENAVKTQQEYEFMRRYVTRFQKACREDPELLSYLQNQMHEEMTPEMRINMHKSNMMDVNLTTNLNPLNENCRSLLSNFADRLVQPEEIADKTFEFGNMAACSVVGVGCSLIPGTGLVINLTATSGTYMLINACKDEIESTGWYQDFKNFTSSDEFTKGCNAAVWGEMNKCQDDYRKMTQQYDAKTAHSFSDEEFDVAIEYGLRYGSIDQRPMFKIIKRGREFEVLRKIELENLRNHADEIKNVRAKIKQNPNDLDAQIKLAELLPFSEIVAQTEAAVEANKRQLAENPNNRDAQASQRELMELNLAIQCARTGHYFFYAQMGMDLRNQHQQMSINDLNTHIQGNYNETDVWMLSALLKSQQECVASMLEYSNRDMLITAWRKGGALPIEKMPESIDTSYDYKTTDGILNSIGSEQELSQARTGSVRSTLGASQQDATALAVEETPVKSVSRLQASGSAILGDTDETENVLTRQGTRVS